ncbi:hypothetical protein ANN_07852 [Periplaneta americana]|uniref:Uncharacterized protein n=1 Tax=Periplaneta americana TaxID=6978 RepID=A0ABQ8SZU0_PERAM|nr:hypothetical protein ANN_07852 [Periplaneta americana]
MFENKVLRKIFGAKRDEVTGEWRKLHNTELHALYSSPDIIRNIKSRRLRWAGHVARMDDRQHWDRMWRRRGTQKIGEVGECWVCSERPGHGQKTMNEGKKIDWQTSKEMYRKQDRDNAGEMSPRSNTESYPAFAHIGLRENPGKNLNQPPMDEYQVTLSGDWNPTHFRHFLSSPIILSSSSRFWFFRSLYRRPPETTGSLDRPPWNVVKRRCMASATSTRGGPTRGRSFASDRQRVLGEVSEAGMENYLADTDKTFVFPYFRDNYDNSHKKSLTTLEILKELETISSQENVSNIDVVLQLLKINGNETGGDSVDEDCNNPDRLCRRQLETPAELFVNKESVDCNEIVHNKDCENKTW